MLIPSSLTIILSPKEIISKIDLLREKEREKGKKKKRREREKMYNKTEDLRNENESSTSFWEDFQIDNAVYCLLHHWSRKIRLQQKEKKEIS